MTVQSQNKILFFIFGLLIGVIGVISAFQSLNDPFILPMEFSSGGLAINIGLLLTALTFTNIPDRIRIIRVETSSTST